MENRLILAIVVVIFVILVIAGFFMGDQQIDVAGCTAKWKTTAITVQKSELCGQSQCVAQPAEQQHNAIIDALLCACDKAKTANYADENANKRIEEVVSLALNYQASAQGICEQSGLPLFVKHAYG
jgi:parvulin-like peptidyl-prolyl isomerase